MNIRPEAFTCPVCHHGVAVPFFDGGRHPLATLGWPDTAAAAIAMTPLPQDFVQCPACTHVWNRSFSYEAIPYARQPNRMYNAGAIWKGHLAETRALLLSVLPEEPTVIDIGCGEGHFVRGIADACRGRGRFMGFDPNASGVTGNGLEFHARLFAPLHDVPALRPDALVIRHVLEHLTDPASLVEQFAWGAVELDKPVYLFAEMPCIDRVFETRRLADFFYEHPSHFTTASFRHLMERAGEVLTLDHGYDREVVFALVRLEVPAAHRETAARSRAFRETAEQSRAAIKGELDRLAASGQRVAIWGGTGKAAAFIHQFCADAQRFPLVVDSDPDKAGTFVPGAGQCIRYRDVLKREPADVVIIPTQWRARDIVAEMTREGISAATILIEHDGQLVDFARAAHPYR